MPTFELLPTWKPASQAQQAAINSFAELLCFGGSAGTYKTEFLLVDTLRDADKPSFNGVILRTSFPELEGKIIPRARDLFSGIATYNDTKHIWKFASGATLKFAHLENDKAVYAHQGSEYSYIGFDESTHRTEFQIRYMLSRLRSTDPSIFPRCRMATNPGGPGHKLHQHIFLGGACPHCQTPVRLAGELYKDATWLSDKKEINMTTQYIFGVWDPNGLLPDYGKQLMMQSGSLAKALLAGCWRSFEGQYYDIWEPRRNPRPMVIPRAMIGDQYWWTHWVGADYGFSGSSAAAYLFAMSPDGIVYCLDEKIIQHRDVENWAKDIYERFCAKKDDQDEPRSVAAMFLSPDCWNDRGDYRPLAGQMNEKLEKHGIGFSKARNDRAGGAMLIYTMLQNGLLVIADTCKVIQESLESRIHDPDEPEKVLKVIGDPLDDAFDGFRYGVYSYQYPANKPLALRINEATAREFAKKTAMAPTMAFIKQQKMLAEEPEDNGPVFTGGSYARHRRLQRKGNMLGGRE